MTDNSLSMWTMYDHPRDFPGHVVVRRWLIGGGSPEPVPTQECWLFDTLENARATMAARGLACLARLPEDDPAIVETWI